MPKKIQTSIFEFRKQHSVESTTAQSETIVISDEEVEAISTKREVIKQEIKLEKVECPVCFIDISVLSILERETHVDDCLIAKLDDSKSNKKIKRDPSPTINGRLLLSRSENASEHVEEVKNTETVTKDKKEAKPKTPIPEIKRLKFPNGYNKISVDAFNYAPDPKISKYFLTHFHADHYMGLNKKWSVINSKNLIYCSEITAKLLLLKLRVIPNIIKTIPLNVKTEIDENIYATFIDANHCPGAVIILFEYSYGQKVFKILHCGDFRICFDMLANPLLQTKIDECYLDTTYLNPLYNFPYQNIVCDVTSSFCFKLVNNELKQSKSQSSILHFLSSVPKTSNTKKNYLLVIGTYTIGKERIAIEIVKKLNTKLYASFSKREILATFEDSTINKLLTTDPLATQVHLIPMRYLTSNDTLHEYFATYKQHFNKVIAFKPTGWTFSRITKHNTFDDMSKDQILEKILNSSSTKFEIDTIINQYNDNKVIQMYNVPYSEHSSFRELSFFAILLDIDKILPTVNIHQDWSIKEMNEWIKCWNAYKKSGKLSLNKF